MRTIWKVLIILGLVSVIGVAYGFGRAQTPAPITYLVNVPQIPPVVVQGDMTGMAASLTAEIQYNATLTAFVDWEELQIQQLQAQTGVAPVPCPPTLCTQVNPAPPPTCTPPMTLINNVCTSPNTPPPTGTLAIGATVKVVSPCPDPCHMWPTVDAGGGVSGTPIALVAGATGKVLAGPKVTGNGGIWWQIALPNGTGWLDPGFVIAQ
jgi:hypothetical protein